MSALRYSARIDRCTLLGPGSRAVIYVHGCCFSCKGCIASGFQAQEPIETTAEEMAAWYLSLEGCEGLTISGGEPMLQAQALSEVVDLIRREKDAGVIAYTGFVYEALLERAKEHEGISRLLKRIDLLIDGPYVQEKDEGQFARGSSNQRLIALSPRYQSDIGPYYQSGRAREMELRLEGQRVMMIGVPSAGQSMLWRQLKQNIQDQNAQGGSNPWPHS